MCDKEFDDLLAGIKRHRAEALPVYHVIRRLVDLYSIGVLQDGKVRSPYKALGLPSLLWQLALDCRLLSQELHEGAKHSPFPLELFAELVADRGVFHKELELLPKPVVEVLVYLAQSMHRTLENDGIKTDFCILLNLAVESFFSAEVERNPQRFRRLWNRTKLEQAARLEKCEEPVSN